MREGEVMGIRGPLGNWYPWEEMEERNVLIIGGGFAFTTLRSSIVYMLHAENRSRFKNVTVIYGARSPGMLLYKEELAEWEKRDDLDLHITVDATDDPNWRYNTGFVPTVTEQKLKSADNAFAIVCGPPIMIRFTQPVLERLGFSSERIILSLEMRMKCGIGICGRCNIGDRYVCKDGPVFSLAQLKELPPEY
jgi:NAD(P)H-flavin reductase